MFFPTNIHWFVEFENLDFELRRTDFQGTGRIRKRRPPTKADYENGGQANLLYTRVSMGNWHPRIEVDEQATWDGDPMTAFQSSFRVLGDERMDISVRQNLISYSLLLDQHDIESSQWATTLQVQDHWRPDSDGNAVQEVDNDGDNNEDDNSYIQRPTRTKHDRGHLPGRGGSNFRNVAKHSKSEAFVTDLRSLSNTIEGDAGTIQPSTYHTYGPSFTADLCVSYMMKLRQSQATSSPL